jgi:hypothetical protein
MASLRWKFSEDQLGEKRDAPKSVSSSSARDRLKALNSAS